MRVRCHLLTINLFYSLLCFGLLGWSGVAPGQVYKSYDTDGNVVFSDKPTQGSREVEISKPNLSDSFEIPPSAPAESTPETEPETKPEAGTELEPVTQPIADGDSADTNNDGRVSRREKEEQRKERRRKKREEAKAAEEY
jgi:hypothetical protein